MSLSKTMYPGMVNSPETTITNGINESDTIIYVLDPARVPEPPNLMTLGTGTNAETVKVLEMNDNAITVERGFQGIPKAWPAGTVIARNFTAYDYDTLKENIEDLEATKETPAGAQAKAEAAAGAVRAELNAHLAEMVSDSVHGMGRIASQDYEEGIWTPNLQFDGASDGIAYSAQLGSYRRIGKVVYWEFVITLNNKGTSEGAAAITGLPFVAGGSINKQAIIGDISMLTTSGFIYPTLRLSGGGNRFWLFGNRDGNTPINITNANFNNTTRLNASGFYFID